MTIYICRSSRYTPEATMFYSVEHFKTYCAEVFGEAPTLTPFGSGYRDEDGNTVLEEVTD